MRILSHSKSKSSLQALESLDREESGEKSSKKISRGAWKKTSAPTLLEDEFPNLTLMEVRQFLKLSRENYFKQTSDESLKRLTHMIGVPKDQTFSWNFAEILSF